MKTVLILLFSFLALSCKSQINEDNGNLKISLASYRYDSINNIGCWVIPYTNDSGSIDTLFAYNKQDLDNLYNFYESSFDCASKVAKDGFHYVYENNIDVRYSLIDSSLFLRVAIIEGNGESKVPISINQVVVK